MKHWVFDIIGIPWDQDAHGPDSYNCWGAVRHALKQEFNLDVPILPIDSNLLQDAILREEIQQHNWHRVNNNIQHGDILLMRGHFGRRHIAIALLLDGVIQVLHSDGHMTEKGPIGEVVLTTLKDLVADYKEVQLWRMK